MFILSRILCEQIYAEASRTAERAKFVAAGKYPVSLLDLTDLAIIISSNRMLFVDNAAGRALVNAFENLNYADVACK